MPSERILLLEDNEGVRTLLEHVLTSEEYQVHPATTVAEAQALLGRGSYDLVLADGMLPDGTGIEVADEAARRGIRVIFMTAYADRFSKHDLARYALLLKPFRPAEMVEAVRRELDNH